MTRYVNSQVLRQDVNLPYPMHKSAQLAKIGVACPQTQLDGSLRRKDYLNLGVKDHPGQHTVSSLNMVTEWG